jgi:NTE family protein
MKTPRAIQALVVTLIISGCAHYPVNPPLAKSAVREGYRFSTVPPRTNSAQMLTILTFSGGGMRASAVAYGVLEELARTQLGRGADQRRFLDDVDVISAVSGGSFTAAYYALYGDRLFTDFESKFLKRDISGALMLQLLMPRNWARLAAPAYNRSDLAADYYDSRLFGHCTFADLMRDGSRPFLMINATDVGLGSHFEFTQDQFDLIGSDLSKFHIARAVAASSAFAPLLPPILLKNYANTNSSPDMASLFSNMATWDASGGKTNRSTEQRPDAELQQRPFIHLLDGGQADNLALRGFLTPVIEHCSFWDTLGQLYLLPIRRVVVIIVDAHTDGEESLDDRERTPGPLRLIRAASGVSVDLYSSDTLQLFRQNAQRAIHQIQSKRAEAAAKVSTGPNSAPVEAQLYLVELHLHNLSDQSDRRFFNSVPTTLSLPSKTVDRLRRISAGDLQKNEVFQQLLRDLNGPEEPATKPRRPSAPK